MFDKCFIRNKIFSILITHQRDSCTVFLSNYALFNFAVEKVGKRMEFTFENTKIERNE